MGVTTRWFGSLSPLEEGVSGKRLVKGDEVVNTRSVTWNGLYLLAFVDFSEAQNSGLCLENVPTPKNFIYFHGFSESLTPIHGPLVLSARVRVSIH